MPEDSTHAVIAHFESRRGRELDNLIRRHGAEPWSAPALSEVAVPVDTAGRASIDRLVAGDMDLVVLITGMGTRRLFDEAEVTGQLAAVVEALRRTTIVARGPKPVFALKQQGLTPTHVAPEPNTTNELLQTLAPLGMRDQGALIVHAGEAFAEPAASLRTRGMHVDELLLYRWDLTPADAVRLEETIHALIDGAMDAAAFTTQVQVRHLFDVAHRLGCVGPLADALRTRTLVGAVGPTCAQALLDRGVVPGVVPVHPKMGHLVVALSAELSRRTLAREQLDTTTALTQHTAGV